MRKNEGIQRIFTLSPSFPFVLPIFPNLFSAYNISFPHVLLFHPVFSVFLDSGDESVSAVAVSSQACAVIT